MTADAPNVQVVDVEPGLWIWRIEHPGWEEDADWQPVVTCVCVDSGGERWLLDPLMPPASARDVWDRLDEHPPTHAAVLLPDHVRSTFDDRSKLSIDALVERYGARIFVPDTWDEDTPRPTSPVETIAPDTTLPGGLSALQDPRGFHETPMWIAEHRTLVFGDGMTERDGRLRVWSSPTHEQRAIPYLRSLLGLPFERVIISHGDPVHSRAEFEQALELPPWPAGALHQAAYRGNLDVVKRLVASGGDLGALDERYHKTPLEWAEIGGHEHVIAYLRSVAG